MSRWRLEHSQGLLDQNSSSPPVETAAYPGNLEKEAPEVPPEDNRVSGDGSLTRLEADKDSFQDPAVQEQLAKDPGNKTFEEDGSGFSGAWQQRLIQLQYNVFRDRGPKAPDADRLQY
ncbi:MAG: hypothetical protein ACOX4H_03240 [Bacillota bacterium]